MNLHETIKQRFNLRHTGDVWQPVCCPIHQEASASAGINLAKNGFNCFVCGGMSLPKLAARIGLEYDATDFFDLGLKIPKRLEDIGIIFVFQPFFSKAIRHANNNFPVFIRKYRSIFKPSAKISL